MVGFFIEGLDCGFALEPIDHGDYDIPVADTVLLFDQDVVPIHDTGLDHAFSFYDQHEVASTAQKTGGNREAVFDILLGQDRSSGSDTTDNRNFCDWSVAGDIYA